MAERHIKETDVPDVFKGIWGRPMGQSFQEAAVVAIKRGRRITITTNGIRATFEPEDTTSEPRGDPSGE